MEESEIHQHARRISQLRVLNAWELVIARPPIRASSRNLLNPFFVADLGTPLKTICEADYDSDADLGSISEEAMDALNAGGPEWVTSSKVDRPGTRGTQAGHGLTGEEEGATSSADQEWKGYATAVGQVARTSTARDTALPLIDANMCMVGQNEQDLSSLRAESASCSSSECSNPPSPSSSSSSLEARRGRTCESEGITARELVKLDHVKPTGALMFQSANLGGIGKTGQAQHVPGAPHMARELRINKRKKRKKAVKQSPKKSALERLAVDAELVWQLLVERGHVDQTIDLKRLPKKHPVGTPFSREAILTRDEYTCVFCGRRGGAEPSVGTKRRRGSKGQGCLLTMEHVVPASAGGQLVHENIACACSACNSARGCVFLHDLVWKDGRRFELRPVPGKPAREGRSSDNVGEQPFHRPKNHLNVAMAFVNYAVHDVRSKLGRRWHQLRGHYVDRFTAIQQCVRSLDHVARFVKEKRRKLNGHSERKGPSVGKIDWVGRAVAQTTTQERAHWPADEWVRRLRAEKMKERERVGDCDTVVERRGVVVHRRWSWDEMEGQDVGAQETQAPRGVRGEQVGEGMSVEADEADEGEGIESDSEVSDTSSEGQSDSDEDEDQNENDHSEGDSEDDEEDEQQPKCKKARNK